MTSTGTPMPGARAAADAAPDATGAGGPLLSVRDLTVTVRATGARIVSGVSFDLADGERAGLAGESGSGKSMTASAIAGIAPGSVEAAGSVLFGGVELVGRTERELSAVRGRGIAMVFQEPLTSLDPLMRVGRQIAGPLARIQGVRRRELAAAIARSLEDVGLDGSDRRIARAYPHELSGGQRQRVALAIALACRPRLLIADEPTTALDVTVQAEILELLERVVEERGMALLFISHDLPVISQVAPRVLVMHGGRLLEDDTLEDLLRDPRTDYARTLIADARRISRLQVPGPATEGGR
ncbi:ABC transporter ATP-binding protein [Schaalia naturae]|uniref:ABC transporter ATP-binding protein n=1 Tax=Schaalia naturae TaxID=635203 RepID=A0ABW2SNZ1_9ACTO